MKNEYDQLISYLTVYPCNLQIIDPNNVYMDHFNRDLAINQFNDLLNTLIDLCSNKDFNDLLQRHGYQSTFIDFSQVIKAGGSMGCCILPILRGGH